MVAANTNAIATPQVVTTTAQEQSNAQTVATAAPVRKYTNTVLEVKKLPPNLNNIASLNGYFQRFGKIVNIQVGGIVLAGMLSTILNSADLTFMHKLAATSMILFKSAVKRL